MLSLALTDCIDRFTAWTRANRAEKTAASYHYHLSRFARWIESLSADVTPPRAPFSVADLSPAIVTTFSRSFHHVQAVQRLCSWLTREERTLPVNPLAGMPKPRCGQRRRTLTPLERVRLLRSAEPAFRRLLLLLRETMCRPQEARALGWDALICEGDVWYFTLADAKGFDRRRDTPGLRVIPVSPRCRRMLERLRRRCDGSRPILLNTRGDPWTANAVRCQFRRLRIRLGIVADRHGERIVPYSFRHTGATLAVAAGVTDFRLMTILGHASTRTTQRYVHPRPADVVEWMKRTWELKSPHRPKNDRPGSRRTRPEDD